MPNFKMCAYVYEFVHVCEYKCFKDIFDDYSHFWKNVFSSFLF